VFFHVDEGPVHNAADEELVGSVHPREIRLAQIERLAHAEAGQDVG
jgi:hypothetical protein